jgi:hypothetical protein
MHKDTRNADELRELGYERQDVGLRLITFWVGGFFVFAIAMGIISIGVYWALVGNLGVPQDTASQRRRLPPAPRLQDNITVKTDIRDMRLAEDQLLHEYGWLDERAGRARIPISRAIDLMAGDGQRSEQRPGTSMTEARGRQHTGGYLTPEGADRRQHD